MNTEAVQEHESSHRPERRGRIRMNNRIGKVIEQVRWDLKRGVIDRISIDYILDRAEEILTEDDYDEFSANREYIGVYQSV